MLPNKEIKQKEETRNVERGAKFQKHRELSEAPNLKKRDPRARNYLHVNEDIESLIPECVKPRKWFAAFY